MKDNDFLLIVETAICMIGDTPRQIRKDILSAARIKATDQYAFILVPLLLLVAGLTAKLLLKHIRDDIMVAWGTGCGE